MSSGDDYNKIINDVFDTIGNHLVTNYNFAINNDNSINYNKKQFTVKFPNTGITEDNVNNIKETIKTLNDAATKDQLDGFITSITSEIKYPVNDVNKNLLNKLCAHMLVNSFMQKLMMLFIFCTVNFYKTEAKKLVESSRDLETKQQNVEQACETQKNTIKQQENLITKLTALINEGFPLIANLEEIPEIKTSS